MKSLRFLAALFVVSLLAVPMFGATSLLTPGGIRYAIEPTPDRPQIEIGRAEGLLRATLIVPTTDDAIAESQAQLAFDATTETLFVVWTRENATGAEIRYVTLDNQGQWSVPRNLAAGAGMYGGVQLVLTRSEYAGVPATLMHVAWWSINGRELDPEYALFAFENGVRVSADVANLVELSRLDIPTASAWEDVGPAVHPALTMARNGETVDIAFGSTTSTAITRVNVKPRKVGPDVRMWRPVGRGSSITPRVNLVSADETPIQAFIVKDRLALYTAGDDFRFVVLGKDNTWSQIHSVHVDEKNTLTDLARDFRDTVEELIDHEIAAEPELPSQ